MKIVILIHQIMQEKFAYGEFVILVMIGYIFMFRKVKKMQNSGLERVAGLTLPSNAVIDKISNFHEIAPNYTYSHKSFFFSNIFATF